MLPSMPSRRTSLLFAAILVAGALLRIAWNDVADYSPADESVYTGFTAFLHDHGWRAYPVLTQHYLANREAWLFPDPLRWGYLALSSVAVAIAGHCTPQVLADLSTTAGILSIALTFLLGRELLGDDAALVASLLTATSPLQLAMGRRALQDEVLCAAMLLTVWLLVLLVRNPERGRRRTLLIVSALLATTLALGIKEAFPFYFPPILAMLWLIAPQPRLRSLAPVAAILTGSALLNAAIFSILARSTTAYVAVWRAATSTIAAPFAVQYQSGPMHRPLFDFLLLAPIVMLLAIAAAARGINRPPVAALVMFAVVALVLFGLFSSKNVRYAIGVDPILRLLAAWLIVNLPRRPWLPLAMLVLIATTELQLFSTVFKEYDVYDPTSANLLEALHVIPPSGEERCPCNPCP
jgi:4-amino-4-deoxy-L-arabinose transferase-like glycosyltransferase